MMMIVPLANNDDGNGLIERALFYLFAGGVRMCRRRHRRLSGTRVGLAYLRWNVPLTVYYMNFTSVPGSVTGR